MTEENYGKNCCLDHCFLLSKTNLSNQNEAKNYFLDKTETNVL